MRIGGLFVQFFLVFIHWTTHINGEDNVEVFCSEDFIRIIVTFNEPFYGRLATIGGGPACSVYGTGHRDLRLDLATDPPGRRRCNVTESNFDFIVQLEIQTNTALLTADDSTYVVRCPLHSPVRATTTSTTTDPPQLRFEEETVAEAGGWPFNGSPGTFGPTEELDSSDHEAPKTRPTTRIVVHTTTEADTTSTRASSPAVSRRVPQQSDNDLRMTRRPPVDPAITSGVDKALSMTTNQSQLNISQIVQPIRGALRHSIVHTRIGRCVAYNGTFILRGQTFDFVQLTDDNGCPLAVGLDPPPRGSTVDALRAFAVESQSAHFFAHCTVHTCRGACETPECASGAGSPIFVVDGGADTGPSTVRTVAAAPVVPTVPTLMAHPERPVNAVERRRAQFTRQFESAARDDDDGYTGAKDSEWNFLAVGIVLCLVSFMVVLLLIQYICVPKCDDSQRLIRSYRRVSATLLSGNLEKPAYCTRDDNDRRDGALAPDISLDALPPPPSIPLSRLLQFARRSSAVDPIQRI